MAERRLLDSTDLFAALPPDVLAALRDETTVREIARNEVLFEQGDASSSLYVVSSGRIAIATQSGDGRESVIAVLEEGGLFGELPLFDDEPRVADVRALVDSTVLELAYEPVRRVLRERPELLWILVRLLVTRLRATDEALADAVFLDVPARTAKRLLELAGDDDSFTLPLTQEELAAMVGASRERVNKAISTFIRLDWLELEGRNHYRILDRQSLEERGDALGLDPGVLGTPEGSERQGAGRGGSVDQAARLRDLEHLGDECPSPVGVARAVASEQRPREVDATVRSQTVQAALVGQQDRPLGGAHRVGMPPFREGDAPRPDGHRSRAAPCRRRACTRRSARPRRACERPPSRRRHWPGTCPRRRAPTGRAPAAAPDAGRG